LETKHADGQVATTYTAFFISNLRPENAHPDQGFSQIPLVPPGKCRDNTSNYVMADFFHILSKSLTNHPTK
jgi:hypothetical protein